MKVRLLVGAFALLMAAPGFAKTCATYNETSQLQSIDTSIDFCNSYQGSFVVNLPAGMSYKLYHHSMEKGDSCGISEKRTANGVRVTVTVDMSPDSSENCQLYMFDPKNPSNHADMSISAQIDS